MVEPRIINMGVQMKKLMEQQGRMNSELAKFSKALGEMDDDNLQFQIVRSKDKILNFKLNIDQTEQTK